jgi:FkbM family methyltransferase
VGDSLREYGEWAQIEIDFLLEFVAEGSTVLDIGSYLGTHALSFAEAVGPAGHVYAFEPQPQAFKLLLQNVARNELGNVTPKNVAIGASPGMLFMEQFPINDRFNGGSSQARTLKDADLQQVRLETIDSLHLKACDLVKVDVEGTEFDVIRGMRETLLAFNPVIFVELNEVAAYQRFLDEPMFAKWNHYLVRSSPFNPKNIYANQINFFGEARETGVLMVGPNVRVEERMGLFLDVLQFDSMASLEAAFSSTPRFGDNEKYELNRERLESRVHSLTLEAEGLRFANKSLQKIISEGVVSGERVRHEFENSTSWKATRPMRAVSRLLRKLVSRHVG